MVLGTSCYQNLWALYKCPGRIVFNSFNITILILMNFQFVVLISNFSSTSMFFRQELLNCDISMVILKHLYLNYCLLIVSMLMKGLRYWRSVSLY